MYVLISFTNDEIVDGKQRLIGSIKPFVEGKTRLNGVYTPELRTFNIKDINGIDVDKIIHLGNRLGKFR